MWTYNFIAMQLSLRLCTRCAAVTDAQHYEGLVELEPEFGRVHWADRRATRRGIRRFLMLAATVKYPDARNFDAPWLMLYEQNVGAQRLARVFHLRFPREWSETDRAKVRLWLNRWVPRPLDVEFPEQREKIRRVRDWSRP